MKISADAAMPQELATLAGAGGDATNFGLLLEGATPKPGKMARKRAARPPSQPPLPVASEHSTSSPAEQAIGARRSRPESEPAQEAAPTPHEANALPRTGGHSRADALLQPRPTNSSIAAGFPPAPQIAAPAGPAPRLDPATSTSAPNPASQESKPTQTAISGAPGPVSAPDTPAKAGMSRAAPVTAPASESASPQLPVIRLSIQSAEPLRNQPAPAPAPAPAPPSTRPPTPSAHHGATAMPGTGPRSPAPEPLASGKGAGFDSGPGSDRCAGTPAVTGLSAGFNLLLSEAGSFRSEVDNVLPGPVDSGPDTAAAAELQDQTQHLGDQLSPILADVVISLSDDARLDVTLGTASPEDASRMEAGTASLQAELIAHGTEVEAIRVELRPEPAPDARTGSSSAAWLQNGASHGWTGSRDGSAADRPRSGLLRPGLSARLPGAGGGNDAAASIGKVDRYA